MWAWRFSTELWEDMAPDVTYPRVLVSCMLKHSHGYCEVSARITIESLSSHDFILGAYPRRCLLIVNATYEAHMQVQAMTMRGA